MGWDGGCLIDKLRDDETFASSDLGAYYAVADIRLEVLTRWRECNLGQFLQLLSRLKVQ